MANRTPSQTIGPFFHEALRWRDEGHVAFAEDAPRVTITGRLLDGAGEPVADALIETWQLGPDGKPPKPASGASNPNGFGRVQTGRDGAFRIDTVKPGGPAPHLEVTILSRGLLAPLRTRVYLAEESAVRADPLLAPIAGSPRIATLVAKASGPAEYRWDIRMQGEAETVFFAP